jgi:hypothetical protein
LDAVHGLTGIPKLQREIGALVASQSIACQLSDPCKTVAGNRLRSVYRRSAGFPSQCFSSPIPFQPPSAAGNHTPDGFHYPKGPRTLKKTVQRSEGARASKRENEPMAAMLQRVKYQHDRDSE